MARRIGVALGMKWNEDLPVEQNARERLPRLLEKFYAAGRDVLRDDTPETLHRFRLRGKRIRYTFELFRPVYGPGLGKLIKGLRKAQDALGAIQDCEAANEILAHPEFQKWVVERQGKLREDFRAYWKDEFDSPGQDQHWLRYLKTYARRRPGQRGTILPKF